MQTKGCRKLREEIRLRDKNTRYRQFQLFEGLVRKIQSTALAHDGDAQSAYDIEVRTRILAVSMERVEIKLGCSSF